jgi:Flp pilus assembly protein TadD
MPDVLVRIVGALGALIVAAALGGVLYTHDILAPAREQSLGPHVAAADADGTLADLKRVSDLRPGSEAFVTTATLDLRVRRYRAGAAAAEQALRREPQNFSAWVLLGVARRAAGDEAAAQRAFVHAHRLNPFYAVPR